MSHFFRNALRSKENNTTSYLLFDTGCDSDILHLTDQIKEEIRLKLPYSSSLINSLMSALFSLTLRRYEDSVIISSDEHNRWKKEYGISDRHIIGILTEIIRDGKSVSVKDRKYLAYVHLWCDFFPVRAFIIRADRKIKRTAKNLKKRLQNFTIKITH